jgi:aminoglycoside phosphotransferase (APT) family kinase protein
MVLEAVDGETIARKIQRDDDFADARPRLVADFGHALAKIHALDTSGVQGLEETDQLAYYTDVLDSLGQPHPVLELVRNWLLDTRPDSDRTCVVHGDFRLGNVIVGHEGLRAVIDWELAHLGDPMEDLGWLCVKAWRFGGAAPVAGLGDYDELFSAYETAGGAPIDPAVVHWWEVLGTWKWAIMCILQASVHLNGMTRSHELAAIGRRVCENEHDLLTLLDGRW